MLKVMKFGGTSVGSTEAMLKVREIVSISSKQDQVILVLSAMSGITNELVKCLDFLEKLTKSRYEEAGDHEGSIKDLLAVEEKGIKRIDELITMLESKHMKVLYQVVDDSELTAEIKGRLDAILTRLKRVLSGIIYIEELNDKSRDLVLSFGERLSCTILEGVFRDGGLKCQALRSGKVGIITDSNFGNSSPNMERTIRNLKRHLLPIVESGTIPIITGYFGVDSEGNVTTFGRGGSDFSAGILGAALDADLVEIYTDVDGFFSADPRSVPESRILRELDYEEAAELAYFGAKVLHPRTIEPLRKKRIPIVVRNTFNPGDPGSKVLVAPTNGQTETGKIRMRAVAAKGGLAIIKISGDIAYQPFFTTKVHNVLDEMSLNVFALSTSMASFSFLIEGSEVNECLARLKKVPQLDFDAITVYKDVALICVVGHNIEERIGIAAQIFTTIAEKEVNIRMISEGTSEVAVNFVIDEKQKDVAVKALHDDYCRED